MSSERQPNQQITNFFVNLACWRIHRCRSYVSLVVNIPAPRIACVCSSVSFCDQAHATADTIIRPSCSRDKHQISCFTWKSQCSSMEPTPGVKNFCSWAQYTQFFKQKSMVSKLCGFQKLLGSSHRSNLKEGSPSREEYACNNANAISGELMPSRIQSFFKDFGG